ncbi:MAG: UDP-N-acetylmuramoyl-tripeptide--D-alanyl-D-alanine ligase [Candidatus Rokubacteria bacterium]|nr:UDP-N-acetylmuramoyl-tripeptide--D-alanyl-D-alanine ligase [Candidatus Rokubacteria bacterium]
MPRFTVQDVVRATHGALVGGDLGIPVTGVSVDTRTLRVGEAFFAIKGHHLDGHAFLAEAAGRGASCLVVHQLPDEVPAGVPVVLVEDTTRALGRIAGFHRSRFDIPVVAVTGSNGKTTTKEMTAAVLGTRWSVLKSAASFNNQWGLPLTLLGLSHEYEAAVLELGANQPGEIAYLAELCRPTVAVVTTVAVVHTEFFKTLEGVREEKAALVRAVFEEGSVVLNGDDPRVRAMARDARGRVIVVGLARDARVRAVGELQERADGIGFTLEIDGRRRAVRLAFLGPHNVTNALASAGAGVALGLSLDEIAAGLEAARPLKGRLVWRRAGSIRILDDTYNANPASVRAALAALAPARGAGRLLVALGDMLELGDSAAAAHRDVGRLVAECGAAEFVGVGSLMRHAAEAARDAGLLESRHVETFQEAVALLLKRLAPGDTLLVKGSRGMRMERVVDALVARLGGGE